MLERSSYKAGEQFRVVGLPPDIKTWVSPDGPISESGKYLKNGDIIILSDPPTTDEASFMIAVTGTRSEFLLRYGANALMFPQWVEAVARTQNACVCDIMVTGCICGVFQEEERLRRSDGAGG